MDYRSAILLFLIGFGAALLAGRSMSLRWRQRRAGDLPMTGGAVRLDLLGRRGAPTPPVSPPLPEEGIEVGTEARVSEAEAPVKKSPARRLRAQRRK